MMPFLIIMLSIKLGFDNARAGASMFVGTLVSASGMENPVGGQRRHIVL